MKNTIYKKGMVKFKSWKFRDSSLINKVPIFDGVHPIFNQESVHSDEKTFVENFANPMYCVEKDHAYLIVEENGEKISFKTFSGVKIRREGKSWFKVIKHMTFLTVNRRTGDVYFGNMSNYHMKRKVKKKIRRNFFLNDPLNSFLISAKNLVSSFANESGDIVSDAAEIFINSITRTDFGLSREQKLFKFYLDKKGFKYPNNFWAYKDFLHEKDFKKSLKKNSLRLVDSFMESKGLSGKKVKKILHVCKKINMGCYEYARNLFGIDWLNQDNDVLENIFNYSNEFGVNLLTDLPGTENFKELLSNGELKKVFKTFKNLITLGDINNYSFHDHVRMYVNLKQYGETELKWETDGSDWNNFHLEHLNWTDKLEHYQRGTYIRTYPKYFFDEIQIPINNYHPIILFQSRDFNEESQTQSNCVKGYIGKVSSFIVSLRKDSQDSDIRATIEYRIVFLKNSGKVHAYRVQTRGKYNQTLDDTWHDILLKLDQVVISCFNRENFETVKLEKLCSNGTKLYSDSHFDEDGNLQWSFKPIQQNFYLW